MHHYLIFFGGCVVGFCSGLILAFYLGSPGEVWTDGREYGRRWDMTNFLSGEPGPWWSIATWIIGIVALTCLLLMVG